MYFVLIVCLSLLFYLNYAMEGKKALSPGGLYCAVLILSAFYGLFWYREWELSEFRVKTVLVILTGAVCFSLAAWTVHVYAAQAGRSLRKVKKQKQLIAVPVWKKVLMLAVQLYTVFLAVRFYGGTLTQLPSAIMQYRVASVQGNASLPKLLSILLNTGMVNGYLCGYILVYYFVHIKQIKVFWAVQWVLSIGISLFGGSRGGAVSIIFVTFAVFLVLYGHLKQESADLRRDRRIRAAVLAAAAAGILLFVKSAEWIGRTNEYSAEYYFAIYLSAPLKNLDWNISQIDSGLPYGGFRDLNGLSLGNVGTVYTAEYAQGGIPEVVITSLFLGFLTASAYEIVRRQRLNQGKISFALVIYAYFFYAESMIIFGDTFIQSIFSMFFIKVCACMLLLLCFYNGQLRAGNKVIKLTMEE